MSLLVLTALVTAALPASAQEPALGKAEVLALAKAHGVLCEGWRDQDESCQSLLFLDVGAGEAVTELNRLQIADTPDVGVGIANDVTLEGGAICTTVDFGPEHTVILMDGTPSDEEMAGHFLDALKTTLAAYDGKRACETFRRDAGSDVIRSSTTIDGKPAPELDSVYRLLPGDARVRLRPLIEGDGSQQDI